MSEVNQHINGEQEDFGTWQKEETLVGLRTTKGNTLSYAAKHVRNYFASNYNSPAGSVPWEARIALDPATKAAKKNKKRKNKKRDGKEGYTDSDDLPMLPTNMITVLREELEKAKSRRDHKKAGEMREQIWVLTDMVAGVKTEIPDDELARILDNIPIFEKSTSKSKEQDSHPPPSTSFGLSEPEKEIKKLRKKLDQIYKLKDRRDRGEELEINQLEKITTEDKIKEEIHEMEDILINMSLRH